MLNVCVNAHGFIVKHTGQLIVLKIESMIDYPEIKD